MSTNPFDAGLFYQGEFVTELARFRFDNPLRDQRQVIAIEIEEQLQFTVLTLRHSTGPFVYFRVSSGGSLLAGTTLPSASENQTAIIRGSFPPPFYLVFTDENRVFRYVYLTGTISSPTLVSSASIPVQYSTSDSEFVGAYLEMLGVDGHTMYRITVDSSDVIHLDVYEDQTWRTQPIVIQNGHPFLYHNSRTYLARLTEMGTVDSALPLATAGYAGVVTPRIGVIRLSLQDPTVLDFLADQPWDGRTITVRFGVTDEEINVWPIGIRGMIQDAEWDEDELTITLRDPGTILKRPLQTEYYQGTGGVEGGADLKGRIKPIVYGTVFHLSPILLDESLNLYGISTRPLTSVDRVTDGGVDLTVKGDLSDNLLTWQPNQTEVNLAHVYFDFARGLMRTASPAQGRVTCSVNNFVTSDLGQNYAIADIVQAIATDRLPEVSLSINSFIEHRTDIPYRSGIFIDQETTIENVFNELTRDIGTCVGLDRLSNLYIRRIKRRVPSAFITDNDIVEQTLRRQSPYLPGVIYKLGHRRTYSLFTETDFLGAAAEFLRNFLINDYRYAVRDLTGTNYSRFTSAETKVLYSHFNDEVSAETLIDEIVHAEYQFRDLYIFDVENMTHLFNIADTIQLQYPRFDLSVPRIGIIIGIQELSPSIDSENLTRLTVLC